MSYSAKGNRPAEWASKSSHHHIIKDEAVQEILERLWMPDADPGPGLAERIHEHDPVNDSRIQHVIAVDGGYTETVVRKEYPSSTIHFFQFGAVLIKLDDLEHIARSPFISPEDMARLKNIERLKLPLPTRGLRLNDEESLCDTVRRLVHEFFLKETLGEQHNLLDTLAWFVFRRYKGGIRTADEAEWVLSSHPVNGVDGAVVLHESEMSPDGTFNKDGHILYLTDIFRLHEIIDEESGAAGICSFLAGVIEHLILVHIIRHLLAQRPSVLGGTLFLIDRPTGFFGQTARLHIAMFDLVRWLFQEHELYLAGLEKSGAFVDHAAQIGEKMGKGTYLILDDQYIYRYISPGKEDPNRPYASSSYYGHKVIFKNRYGQMHVVSVPVPELKKFPAKVDLPNLDEILTHVESLRCNMYDSALLPIALANKLVSLAAHPSTKILQQFARDSVA